MSSCKDTLLPFAVLLLGLLALAGCRGETFQQPPVHPLQNMDFQKYLQAQEPSSFWADGRAVRPPVPGTVAQGQLRQDEHLDFGKVGGEWATSLPMPVTPELLKRGQGRFNIYCAVCHDESGYGKSVMATRGIVPPPSYHQDRLRALPIGQIYDIATNGVRTMKGYRAQVPVKDRWAIAAYVRTLQISQLPADAPPAPVEENPEIGHE